MKINPETFPRVTRILEEAGFTDFSRVPPAVLSAAQDFGTNVHLAAELWDEGDLDIESLSPALLPYLDAWRLFLNDYEVHIIDIEKKVFSRIWQYQGRLDRIAEVKGVITLIDIKSATAISPATAIQTAGYKIAVESMERIKIKQRMCVQLCDDGRYKVEVFKDKNDITVFKSAVITYHWKAKHKLLKGE